MYIPPRRPLVFRVGLSALLGYEIVACFANPSKLPTITNLSIRHRWVGPLILGGLLWDFIDIQKYRQKVLASLR